jgi:hypothetical protein
VRSFLHQDHLAASLRRLDGGRHARDAPPITRIGLPRELDESSVTSVTPNSLLRPSPSLGWQCASRLR